jgi:hypothetical protein
MLCDFIGKGVKCPLKMLIGPMNLAPRLDSKPDRT